MARNPSLQKGWRQCYSSENAAISSYKGEPVVCVRKTRGRLRSAPRELQRSEPVNAWVRHKKLRRSSKSPKRIYYKKSPSSGKKVKQARGSPSENHGTAGVKQFRARSTRRLGTTDISKLKRSGKHLPASTVDHLMTSKRVLKVPKVKKQRHHKEIFYKELDNDWYNSVYNSAKKGTKRGKLGRLTSDKLQQEKQDGRNSVIPVEDCNTKKKTVQQLGLKNNNGNKSGRKLNGKLGKCKVCNKLRVSAPAPPWEHRLFPRLSEVNFNSSIFQKVPISFPTSHRMDRERWDDMSGLKKSVSVVLNSLSGNGAFYAYKNVNKVSSSNISKEDVNTNKSAAVNDKMMFMSKPYNRGEKGEIQYAADQNRTSSEMELHLGKGPTEGTREDMGKSKDPFHLKWNSFPSWSDAECLARPTWLKDRDHTGSRLTRTFDSAAGSVLSKDAPNGLGTFTGSLQGRRRLHSDLLNPKTNLSHALGSCDLENISPRRAAEKFSLKKYTYPFGNGCVKNRAHTLKKSQMAVENQLCKLNSLLQHFRFGNGKTGRAKRLQIPYNRKLFSGNFPVSDSPKHESLESDSKDTKCTETLSSCDFKLSNCENEVKNEGEKSLFLSEPPQSKAMKSDSTRILRSSDRRNRMHLIDKTNLFSMETATSTKPPFNIETSVSSSASDSFRKNADSKKNSGLGHYVKEYNLLQNQSEEKKRMREHFPPHENIRPNRKRWKLRHEPYKCPSRGPGFKYASVTESIPTSARNISLFTYGKNPSLYKTQPVKGQLITSNIDIHDSFHDLFDTGRFSCSGDVAPKNKNNCSPLRRNQLNSKSSVEEQPIIANLHLAEHSNRIGFGSAIENSSLMFTPKPRGKTDDACFTDEKTEYESRLLLNLPNAWQTSEEQQPAKDATGKDIHKANKDSSSLRTYLGQNPYCLPQICHHSDEAFGCQINSPLRAVSPHIDSSVGFGLTSRPHPLTDSGMQTSPCQVVGVAVQTHLTMMRTSKRKSCKTRTADTRHPGLRAMAGLAGRVASSGWKRRLKRPNVKRGSDATPSEQSSVTQKLSVLSHEDDEERDEKDAFVSYCHDQRMLESTHIDADRNRVDMTAEASESVGILHGDSVQDHNPETPELTPHLNSPIDETALSSPKPSSPVQATAREYTKTRPESPNSAVKNYESDYSYVKTPKWCNVKIEEIDRRVKRALQLRQELRKSRSNKTNPTTLTADSLDGRREIFKPLNHSTPKTESNATFKFNEVSKSPNSLQCPSINDSSQIEMSTASFMGQTPLAGSLNALTCSHRSPSIRDMHGLPDPKVSSNNDEMVRHSRRVRSQSTSSSVCIKNNRSHNLGSTSGSTSTKLQKSRSFHYGTSSSEDKARHRTTSATPQDVNLKRTGTHDKNSPPTKQSKMENMLTECPQLIAELVQTLPRVPLASFVEWFIETSNPAHSTATGHSPGPTDGRTEAGKTSVARPLLAVPPWLPKGKDDVTEGEAESRPFAAHHAHGDFSMKALPPVFRDTDRAAVAEHRQDVTKRTGGLTNQQKQQQQQQHFLHNNNNSTIPPQQAVSNRGEQLEASESSIQTGRAAAVYENSGGSLECRQSHGKFGDSFRRTVIALRKSSDISGIVTKFSCHD